MEWVEEKIKGRGGLSLFTRRSQVAESKGGAVILHGYGEHSGRYEGPVRHLNSQGWSCFLLDHRGHGHSEGPRGAVLRWDEYLDDLELFLAKVSAWHGSDPELLIGHSMGGLVAGSYTLFREHRFRLLSLSSPFFGLAFEPPAVKMFMARVFSKILPRVSPPTEIDPASLSTDPAVGEAYVRDPLVLKVFNARFLTEAMTTQAACLSRAGELKVEAFLLQYGLADSLTDPRASERFFEGVGVTDKTRLGYDGMYHEIFNEVERERVYRDLTSWAGERV